jgi:hypothetical protein
MRTKKRDCQLVELAGRNWLTSELMRAGIEVARPERDRGIDLIAYLDQDKRGHFVARPIQMKAASRASFGLDEKYAKFPNLLLVYVWNLGADSPKDIKCFALTYGHAKKILNYYRWTGPKGKRRFATSHPSEELRDSLKQYEMTYSEKWDKLFTFRRGKHRN